MTAPTPADIDAIRERHAKAKQVKDNEPAYQYVSLPIDDLGKLLAAVAERDATIERLTREAAIWDAQAAARHADVTALQAEVARLTAERDEAADKATAKERETHAFIGGIVLSTAPDTLSLEVRDIDMIRISQYVVRFFRDEHNMRTVIRLAIARGEPQGDSDA